MNEGSMDAGTRIFTLKYGRMSQSERERTAEALLRSPRGAYLLSQALCLASKEIVSRPKAEQEPSNVADMELLIRECFPFHRAVEYVTEGRKEGGGNAGTGA